MRKVIYILSALLVVFVAVYILSGPQANITNYPSGGKDVIAFGDSLVLGVGSNPSGGFVRMISEDLDMPITNLGVSGDTTRDALARIGELSKYDPKVVILLLGGNDYLQRISLEETSRNLDQIIKNIHLTGAAILLVGIEGEILNNGHREVFDTLARENKTAYVPDILNGVFGRSEFMSDNLHPNDKGYRIMADRIKPTLKALIGGRQ